MTNQRFRVTRGMRSRVPKKAALAFAEAGHPILLLHGIVGTRCTCGKRNCQSPGKHPISSVHPHGHKDATTDLNFIARAFEANPNANYGVVPTGPLLVLDVDGPEGEASVEELGLASTPTVETSRGRHHYLCYGGAEPPPRFKGVDVRFQGNGYVVGPGSRHASGPLYRLTEEPELAADLDFRRAGSKRPITLDFSATTPLIAEGGRNNELTRIAGALRAMGASPGAIRGALQVINQADCSPPLSGKEVSRIANSIGRYASTRERAFSDIADVNVERVQWLYQPYLPRGVLVMLDGRPGLGKSNFLTALVSALTTGRAVPWSEDRPRGKALLLSAEDDPARVLKPRLIANGANVEPGHVRFASELFTLDGDGIALLRAEVAAFSPDLVVIDPLVAFMGVGAELNKANDMTSFMGEIDKVAREFNCTIVFVRHFRKSGDGDAMMQGIGSVALAGRVRSMLVMGIHPDDPEVRAVAHAKSNYGREGPTFTFRLKQRNGVPLVDWLGFDPALDADRLVQPQSHSGPGRPPEQSDAIRAFLKSYLAGVKRDSKAVFSQAKARGFAEVTVRRVARDMGVIFKRVGTKSFWSLP